ncbi:PREDICTED: uncharacterized protein LOC108367347 [Rhagoletis zephyria]|uniref:uncharacterized protein LOC108367347 n=1 Tax=Rhagoletis zephyria TaxID=28612 RepID=UPI0008116744|nr:PREDICTED: uncharacterized protein LOC108367347 [Rhagoletis zephyria]XP_036328512.1 uncharacterized protein LOC118740882 [Rhagoletis pomonella]
MATNPYVKSLIWLVCAGGGGYGLLRLTAPSEEKLERIRATGGPAHLTEEERKKLLFMQRMRDAATGQAPPIYLQKKEK